MNVIVVGAGPVGLLLAAELKLAGADALVIEKLDGPSGEPRARGIGPLATEALVRRGLGADLAEHDAKGRADKLRDHGSAKGHFASIFKIDPDVLEEPDRRATLIWQPELEKILLDYARSLDVDIRYGTELTQLHQDADGVIANGLRADYLVGCDGGRSTVRKLAGFEFPGTAPLMTARRVAAQVTGELPPPGRLDNGTLLYGEGMVATFDFGDLDRHDGPVTAAEMQASIRRVAGVDVTVTNVGAGLRFTDHARQVTNYRHGRVLLAGDAAHVHSPNGGQGLNLGLMDAVNLGWKLAGGRTELLDTYNAERHPVGAAVLHNTRAQSALLRPGPHTDALRDIVSDLMDIPEVIRYLGRMMSGLGIRHELPYQVDHPLTGTYCPNLHLTHADGTHGRLSDLTSTGGLLHIGPPEIASTGREDLAAALIRPDGVIAWAAAPGDSLEIPTVARSTWE
ncbi:2-polyprenyl-6-methoxyphenol hydroxylase-like FAD-dependent oxidoreductase [Nocardia tenerifensis]|uniref:2-polyprenyl-6-methoxyphenol hydroxylase-like FAD-dependent oxidoreductase n=1 Tax=Nocardia tenerifensis TaxID=228006 RepID=A0A318JNT9_9NOCA|nr:FAD-dependent monooxygenase [Nocardia tenerifensis]PXX55651.1 2-polyprenyl-6-methoxyphenol hydroxylase-like FAD-dependent oxidoreductase [Nocardia tenerifensis]